jgi:hypothetical protein
VSVSAIDGPTAAECRVAAPEADVTVAPAPIPRRSFVLFDDHHLTPIQGKRAVEGMRAMLETAAGPGEPFARAAPRARIWQTATIPRAGTC